MSLRDKLGLSDELRGRPGRTTRSARATRSAREAYLREVRPYRQGFTMGLCVGTSLALLVGVIAYIVTGPKAAPVASSPAPGRAAATATAKPAGQAQPQAAIDVTARHLGNLQVQIEAQVSAPGSYDAITMAQVVAYSDMVAMPMSHKQGPITMAESAGKGRYQAITTLPMAGEYDITVEVKQPMAATAHKRIKVDTVAGS